MIKVEIMETLTKIVEIDAANDDEAINIVKKMYRNSEIIMDADDYWETEFAVIED
jgi:hypothetical protein